VPNSLFYLPSSAILPPPELSPAQTEAYRQITMGWNERKPVMFMGVTGSGKTEIYITAIQEMVTKGKQALLMLPEIAITLQIVHRLQRVFGPALRVYHSRTSTHDRLDVWEGVANGNVSVVVGVRSSLFLPFRDLGLVVVDEEHDSSYKQADPAPRYHGRDAAVFRAHLSGAFVLLGSATPSVESFYKARSGKWHWVELNSRFGNAQLPEIELVDMRKATRTLKVKLELSETVLEAFQETHQQGRQSILFQNRRGYAPFLECKDCGWAAYCPSCDVSLTVHQGRKSLSCHYCGYALPLPSVCVTCGSSKLETKGYGTEKLEESLEQLLPTFRISRMDQDTTQSRVGFDRLIKRMASGDIDILVGTQMVTKGLDFESVTTVAVFDIDRILHYPDFRANERTFQLLSQIAGRAGRRNVQGKVWVQTSVPFHPLFRMVVKGEGELFFQQEVEHRREFGYPPFSRLVRISTRHIDVILAQKALDILTNQLRIRFSPEWVLGPESPPIARIRNQFIFQTLIKIPETHSHVKVKEVIQVLLTWVRTIPECKPVSWTVDVDPV
jgi:primosomal protein N' (replication factor Y) (superfamily II helicase)